MHSRGRGSPASVRRGASHSLPGSGVVRLAVSPLNESSQCTELRADRTHQLDVETRGRPVLHQLERRIGIGRLDNKRSRVQGERHPNDLMARLRVVTNRLGLAENFVNI